MTNPSDLDLFLRGLSPKQLREALAAIVPADATPTASAEAVQEILESLKGFVVRDAMGRWISEHIVPASKLVPAAHARWIPVVRDAMLYVVYHLSASRLAPKLVEQLELPLPTRSETRLLKLIAKVPGLQKLGQVLARNRHLGAPLRRALMELENGIRDVKAIEIADVIRERLGSKLDEFDVRFRPAIRSEASVSAIVRFTWRNPETGLRERGVFKVLKPYIPGFFAEDMEMLQGLAEHFGSKLDEYGLSGDVLADTFTKVRRLLEHEVVLPGEQTRLARAHAMYESLPGVRVPRVIEQLCCADITAMSEEKGTKITDATRRMSKWKRARVGERVVEALVAFPLLSSQEEALFHADPHAGNLYYDSSTDELVIFDWALTESLTREQRRHLALLFGFVGLRDRVSVADEIEQLRQGSARPERIRKEVFDFLEHLPVAHVPSTVDAMRLLERLAMNGVRFPASLVMLSKVMLTLDGVLTDLGATKNAMGMGIARHMVRQSLRDRKAIASPIKVADWFAFQCSALLYLGRLWIKSEEKVFDFLLRKKPIATAIS